MSLAELTWFQPAMMDAALRQELVPVHRFMGAPEGTPLTDHAVGEGGLLIEGSKHWEYAYAIRQSCILAAPGCRALDAGCGRSAFPAYLAGRGVRMFGIDLNESAIACLRPYGVTAVRGDLSALPYRDESFDQVFCISVLEHTPDPLSCFDELWRVTRLGGSLTVTADYAPWGLPARTVAAGRVMDHALLRRLVGVGSMVPGETPALLEGLGYFSQMWPTVVPVYLRFVKDGAVPPDHTGTASLPEAGWPIATLDSGLRQRTARRCYQAARDYLHHGWLLEARALFARAYRLDRGLAKALVWGGVAHLPGPVLCALRRIQAIMAAPRRGLSAWSL